MCSRRLHQRAALPRDLGPFAGHVTAEAHPCWCVLVPRQLYQMRPCWRGLSWALPHKHRPCSPPQCFACDALIVVCLLASSSLRAVAPPLVSPARCPPVRSQPREREQPLAPQTRRAPCGCCVLQCVSVGGRLGLNGLAETEEGSSELIGKGVAHSCLTPTSASAVTRAPCGGCHRDRGSKW